MSEDEPIRFIVTDISSKFSEDDMIGQVTVTIESGTTLKSILIKNWWQYMAIFGDNLTNIRIYREGYLDKVMVSGINPQGERTRVFYDKYPKRSKVRRRWFWIK